MDILTPLLLAIKGNCETENITEQKHDRTLTFSAAVHFLAVSLIVYSLRQSEEHNKKETICVFFKLKFFFYSAFH